MSDHECDAGHFDRTICPEPCGMMHSFCSTCGARADICAHEGMSRTEDVGLTETERVTLRQALLRVLMDEYGGTREDWTGMGSLARVERIVADRVREAEQRGAVQALRDAADDYERMYQQPGSATGSDWLRARADRLAGDER